MLNHFIIIFLNFCFQILSDFNQSIIEPYFEATTPSKLVIIQIFQMLD